MGSLGVQRDAIFFRKGQYWGSAGVTAGIPWCGGCHVIPEYLARAFDPNYAVRPPARTPPTSPGPCCCRSPTTPSAIRKAAWSCSGRRYACHRHRGRRRRWRSVRQSAANRAEGTLCAASSPCNADGLTPPVFGYGHVADALRHHRRLCVPLQCDSRAAGMVFPTTAMVAWPLARPRDSKGRHLAAWLGLVPRRQSSSGGRSRLCVIRKRRAHRCAPC